MSQVQIKSAETKTKTRSAKALATTDEGSPPGKDDPPPPGAGTVPHVANELGKTSRETRKARTRSLLALLALTVIAISAVAAGIIANNAAFWAGASIVFYMALAGVITYAANELGIVSKTADLLRAALKVTGGTPERTESAESDEATPDVASAALVLADRFEKAGQLTEAEHAYLMAAMESGDEDALYWLGQTCVARGDHMQGELWFLKAAGRGHLGGSYRLGCLHRVHGLAIHDKIYNEMFTRNGIGIAAYIIGLSGMARDDKYPPGHAFGLESQFSVSDLAKYAIDPSARTVQFPGDYSPETIRYGRINEIIRYETKTNVPEEAQGASREDEPDEQIRAPLKSEILKDLATTLPDYTEFWQAYFVSLLDDNDADSVGTAIYQAIEEHPENYGIKLLRARLDSSYASEIDVSDAPPPMRAELNFHKAMYIMRDYGFQKKWFKSYSYYGDNPDEILGLVIPEARHYQAEPPWRSQLLGIEAAYEYALKHYQKAAQLLRDALSLEPTLSEPLTLDDVSSLALIFESWGDEAVAPLVSELARARPLLQNALAENDDESRQELFESLISSMAPGVDMRIPIPGSPQFGGVDMVDQIIGRTETDLPHEDA